MEEEQNYKLSKYNSAVAQLIRIDELWKDCHKHSRAARFLQWNNDLDKVWSELSADLEKGQLKLEEGTYLWFNNLITVTGNLSQGELHGFNPSQVSTKHYFLLLQKEKWLRKLQNKLGKGTSYADEFEDDFD
jgi:hypothetical protein